MKRTITSTKTHEIGLNFTREGEIMVEVTYNKGNENGNQTTVGVNLSEFNRQARKMKEKKAIQRAMDKCLVYLFHELELDSGDIDPADKVIIKQALSNYINDNRDKGFNLKHEKETIKDDLVKQYQQIEESLANITEIMAETGKGLVQKTWYFDDSIDEIYRQANESKSRAEEKFQ